MVSYDIVVVIGAMGRQLTIAAVIAATLFALASPAEADGCRRVGCLDTRLDNGAVDLTAESVTGPINGMYTATNTLAEGAEPYQWRLLSPAN